MPLERLESLEALGGTLIFRGPLTAVLPAKFAPLLAIFSLSCTVFSQESEKKRYISKNLYLRDFFFFSGMPQEWGLGLHGLVLLFHRGNIGSGS